MKATNTTDDRNLIGERIRIAREKRNLSQNTLGEKVGVAGNTIHRIEVGEINTKVSTLIAIADVLGVPIEDLCPDRLARKAEPGNMAKQMEFMFSRLNGADQEIVFATMRTMMESMAERERLST